MSEINRGMKQAEATSTQFNQKIRHFVIKPASVNTGGLYNAHQFESRYGG